MRDMMNNMHPVRVLSPVASAADNTAQVGQIVDHKGYDSATYVILTGALPDADATFTVLLEEGDDAALADAAAVADDDLVGTEALASFVFSDDNKCFKLGYRGIKRYTRLTITPAANASASLLAAVCIMTDAALLPTANPPA